MRRRRPSSSGPPGDSRRDTSVVSARSSTVSVRELSGTSAVRATSHPRTTARRTPMKATTPSRSASVRSSELTLSRVAICSAPPFTRMPDWTPVPGGRCSTSSRIWFPSTVTVVKKLGASPLATNRTWPVTGSPPPETTAPLVSITWPSVAVVEPISCPARTFFAAVVSELSVAWSRVLRATRNEASEAASTATTTAAVVASTSRARKVTRPAARSPRRGPSGCSVARPPPPACGAGSRRRRPASWSPSRSRSPTPGSTAPRG